MKVLFIDNFDLFTHNLVDEFEKKECEVLVYRNDVDVKIVDNAIKKFRPGLIVVSSGPGNVPNTGNAVSIVNTYAGKIPIFGVGLGCSCIIEAFGGKVDRSPVLMHGKSSKINHGDKAIFKKLANSFVAGRYNALAAVDVPYSFEVSARDDNDIVMGVRYKDGFVEGIMFHPESILTPSGSLIIDNVLKEAGKK